MGSFEGVEMDKKLNPPAASVEAAPRTGRASQAAGLNDTNTRHESAFSAALISIFHRRTLWLILGIGALLRLATLGVQSLWLDEGVTFWTIHRDLPGLVDQLATGFRPFYFLVLYPAYLIGTDEWLLRLPSALAGIASIALLYLLGKKLFDARTGFLAAALLAFSPLHLWYSQEARFYALLGLLSLGAVYFAVRGITHNRLMDWILFGLFEGLGLWTESGAVWYILAINLAGLLLLQKLFRERLIFGWVLAQVVGVALYLPRLSTFASAVQGGGTSWIPPATIRELLRLISDFSGGFMQPAWYGIISILFVGAGVALGARRLLREVPDRMVAYAVLIPWLVIPVAANFFLSQPYFRPEMLGFLFGSRSSIFLTRNLITIIFPLLLLLARSLMLLYHQPARSWRILSQSLTIGLLFLYGFGYFNNHLAIRKEDYRSAAYWISENAEPGDLVLTSPGYLEQPVAYYYYHKEPVQNLPLQSVRDGVVDSWQVQQDPYRLAEIEPDLMVLIQQHERIWLVTTDNVVQQADPDLLDYLRNHAKLTREKSFKNAQVRLYVLTQGDASRR
jgi:mannosyltransferase